MLQINKVFNERKDKFMKELNRWVDVRKKQVREVTNLNVSIKKLDELNAYLTLKEVKDIEQPYYIYINGELVKKLDKNYTIVEYTPLDESYNVRAHVNDKKEILEYYFDITYGKNKIVDGIPYYNDLFLDIIYYQEPATKSSTYIHLDDRADLENALREGVIDKDQYDYAHQVTEKLLKELKTGQNRFVNRGIGDVP